ncbi:hypothetical protein HDU78_009770 [Chytriomyces hyalinus]|nr:hypothetical protein HDU78_009770 [Chytriomyces hyalinus]
MAHFVESSLQQLQQFHGSADTAVRMHALKLQRNCLDKMEGLSLFCASNSEITLCGSVFVVDITLDKSDGSVVRVKLSVAAETTVEDKDGGIFLTRLLKQSDFKAFTNSIAALAACDRLSNASFPAFTVLHNIHTDMAMLYSRELAHCNGNLNHVLTEGHGVFVSNFNLVGSAFVFWAGKADLLELEEHGLAVGNEKRELEKCNELYAAHVRLGDGNARLNLLPSFDNKYLLSEESSIPDGMECVSVASLNGLTHQFLRNPSAEYSDSFRASLIIEFEPAIPCTKRISESLASMPDISIPDMTTPSTTSYPRTLQETHYVPRQSLEATHILHHSTSQFSKIRFTPALLKSTDACSHLSKVSCAHPSQLLSLIQFARRQIVFNTIVASLFTPSPPPMMIPSDAAKRSALFGVIDVVSWNPSVSVDLSIAVIGRGVVIVQVRFVSDTDGNDVEMVGLRGDGNFEMASRVLNGTLDLGLALVYV